MRSDFTEDDQPIAFDTQREALKAAALRRYDQAMDELAAAAVDLAVFYGPPGAPRPTVAEAAALLRARLDEPDELASHKGRPG